MGGYPLDLVRSEVVDLLREFTRSRFGTSDYPIVFKIAPPGMGDLCIPLHPVARACNCSVDDLGREFVEFFEECAKKGRVRFVRSVEFVRGFLNIWVNEREIARLLFKLVRDLGDSFGKPLDLKPMKILIEHTSANPIHPLHLGHGRNAVLGDTLARLLKFCGHEVRRHFYVNDCGLQVAYVAYGFKLLGSLEVPEGWKPDHYVGFVYAAVNCIVELLKLKKKLEELKNLGKEDEYRLTLKELDDWLGVAGELREKLPHVFDRLTELIKSDPNPEASIMEINRRYEAGDPEAVKLVRSICELCLRGFKETLAEIGIEFDSWDWESDIAVWSGAVRDVVKKLASLPFAVVKNGALTFRASEYLKCSGVSKVLGISDESEVPDVTLTRRDGTTLYVTRDVVYTMWKFRKFGVDKVINVISSEQRLAQLHLKILLHALGYSDYAKNTIHYSYEFVQLPGIRMSGRRGRYVTLDEVVNELRRRCLAEVNKRQPHLSNSEKENIARAVAKAALRYAFVCVSPSKVVTFDWSKVLDFSRNSGPFLQYSYARACGILRRVESIPDLESIQVPESMDPSERELIVKLCQFPDVVAEAERSLRVDVIADYANSLCLTFNTFYERVPVLQASEPQRIFRLGLVYVFKKVLGIVFDILGLEKLERI
ncbi:MAG: arginine--tRNA ligase [Thermoprotei archaeon]|nr:MAG: arginine--tRNA ligase [Thermoprotei archaeon]